MKRILLALLGVAMLMGLASVSMAATSELFWNITVSVASDPIDLTRDPLDTGIQTWGPLNYNTEYFSNNADGNPRMTLSNIGYATIDYSAYVTATANNWGFNGPLGVGNGGNGADTCVLAGVFCEPLVNTSPNPVFNHSLVLADFGNEDIMNNGLKFADDITPLVYTRPGEDAQFLPYNVPSNLSTRNLRLYILTPTFPSATTSAVLHIVIGARVAVIGG